MATTALAAGEIATGKITLTANTVDTVTFTDDVNVVEVISDGTADLFVRLDGTDPAVNGKFSWRLPAGSTSVREIPVPNNWSSTQTGQSVKLISSGTTAYSVTKVG